MDYVRLGSSGLKITELTFGTALTIGTESQDISFAQELIDSAWNMGIRSFDTSNNYGMGTAEEILGNVMRKYPRHEYVIATKGSWPIGDTPYDRGLSRKHILWVIDESLSRLKTDYVDLYYAHRYDSDAPMEEIVRTFNSLIQTGKIRYWATSEWSREALEKCNRVCDELRLEKPIAEQFIYSYAVRKAERNGVMDFCREKNVGMLGFSPLCQGFLTGKYKNGVPRGSRISKSKELNYDKTINFYQQNKERIDYFLKTCDAYNVDYVSAALQWCVRRGVYPVFGASKKEQLKVNVRALFDEIPNELWNELERG